MHKMYFKTEIRICRPAAVMKPLMKDSDRSMATKPNCMNPKTTYKHAVFLTLTLHRTNHLRFAFRTKKLPSGPV